jgi:ureidoacrylate peracid hydrolase
MRHGPYAYLYPTIPPAKPEPGKSALLIVDMQYYHAHPDYGWGRRLAEQGVFHLAAPFVERVQAVVIPNIQLLQRACRTAGIDVIFVKIEMQRADLRDANPQYRLWGYNVVTGSKDAQVLDEIAPLPGEIVLNKRSTDAFNSTDLERILHNVGIETLIIAGVNTNGCVEMTARGAADRGFSVLLVEDACAAIGGDVAHRQAIDEMDGGLISITTAAEVARQAATAGE